MIMPVCAQGFQPRRSNSWMSSPSNSTCPRLTSRASSPTQCLSSPLPQGQQPLSVWWCSPETRCHSWPLLDTPKPHKILSGSLLSVLEAVYVFPRPTLYPCPSCPHFLKPWPSRSTSRLYPSSSSPPAWLLLAFRRTVSSASLITYPR